jgi:hypothetical protein
VSSSSANESGKSGKRFIPPSEAVKELFLYGSALMRMQPDGSFGYVSHEDIRA